MAILGLLIQEPDSVAGVSRRLSERFAQAHFARNAAHNNLPGLARQGFVRLNGQGAERGLDSYEATAAGIEHFRAWMMSSLKTLPVLRDAVRAVLEQIATKADLIAGIAAIEEQERACIAEYEAARRRMRVAERGGRLPGRGELGLHETVQYLLISDEVTYWFYRAARLKRLRESLQYDDEGERGCDDE
jgi:DNA-binding IclR family transcriptional regulator